MDCGIEVVEGICPLECMEMGACDEELDPLMQLQHNGGRLRQPAGGGWPRGRG